MATHAARWPLSTGPRRRRRCLRFLRNGRGGRQAWARRGRTVCGASLGRRRLGRRRLPASASAAQVLRRQRKGRAPAASPVASPAASPARFRRGWALPRRFVSAGGREKRLWVRKAALPGLGARWCLLAGLWLSGWGARRCIALFFHTHARVARVRVRLCVGVCNGPRRVVRPRLRVVWPRFRGHGYVAWRAPWRALQEHRTCFHSSLYCVAKRVRKPIFRSSRAGSR